MSKPIAVVLLGRKKIVTEVASSEEAEKDERTSSVPFNERDPGAKAPPPEKEPESARTELALPLEFIIEIPPGRLKTWTLPPGGAIPSKACVETSCTDASQSALLLKKFCPCAAGRTKPVARRIEQKHKVPTRDMIIPFR